MQIYSLITGILEKAESANLIHGAYKISNQEKYFSQEFRACVDGAFSVAFIEVEPKSNVC